MPPPAPLQVAATYPGDHLLQLAFPLEIEAPLLVAGGAPRYMQYMGDAFKRMQAESLPNVHFLQVSWAERGLVCSACWEGGRAGRGRGETHLPCSRILWMLLQFLLGFVVPLWPLCLRYGQHHSLPVSSGRYRSRSCHGMQFTADGVTAADDWCFMHPDVASHKALASQLVSFVKGAMPWFVGASGGGAAAEKAGAGGTGSPAPAALGSDRREL